MSSSLGTALLVLIGVGSTSAAMDTLLIGDSYASYAKTYITQYCGITTLNKGIGGTTTLNWNEGDMMTSALTEASGEEKNILFMIGGNDFMGAGKCALSRAKVAELVTAPLTKLQGILNAAVESCHRARLGARALALGRGKHTGRRGVA